MELLLDILYIYIALYSVFFLILAIKNLNDRKFRITQKCDSSVFQNKLCVVIYSHNNATSLENLLKLLKAQDYAQQNFNTYVILDNCSDNSEKLFINDDFANVFNIKDQGTIGKDQAISILLEKLSTIEHCNAYVFLDANRYIEKNFLSSINSALEKSPVVSGKTILVGEDLNLRQKIKLTFHKYQTNFILKSRALLGLAMTIDSDMLAMRQDLMEKIGCIDFQNINAELKYSLLLSKIGCKCTYNPNIKTYINIDDFKLRIPSITTRLNLFKNCFTQIWTKNIPFFEQAMSLITPNILVLLLSYYCLISCALNYYFMVDFSVILVSLCVLILGFSLSLVNAELKSKELLYLLLYPLYSLGHITRNFPIIRYLRNKSRWQKQLAKNTQKLIVDVTVTDGKKIIPCKMALLSENGLAKVAFMFRKKKFTTKTNLRMVDAIAELTQKLEDYGFVLRICQCCANFSPNIDGSTNMVKGFCQRQYSTIQSEGGIPTLLWNSCEAFNQSRSHGVIEKIFN